MSFHRLKRPTDRSLGHKLKPSGVPFVLKTQNQPTSMIQSYILALDIAKHKTRFALCDGAERFLAQEDLPVTRAGLQQLLLTVQSHVPDPGPLLVVIEATGVHHLNWAAALSKAGYAVIIINPLAARRLCTVKNSIRDNKSDPIDARGLCAIGRLHGAELLKLYRYQSELPRLCLQRLQTVRKQLRSSLTNLKKTYSSLLDLSFPELGQLMELDGVGLRQLLAQAPTPAAIARMRLSTLQKNWMLRPKAAALKALAARSMADPDLAQANAPALRAILRSLAALEEQLKAIEREIQQALHQAIAPETIALVESIPGFASLSAGKVLSCLPGDLLEDGSNRAAATRLQALMGNDPRLRQSGQWKGHTKMSKRGIELLRTTFFQVAFNASLHDPELRTYYLRKRAQGKLHEVALSHLMRILTRRLIAILRSKQPYDPRYNLTLKKAA
jgi:transposase